MNGELASIIWGISGAWPWAGVIALAIVCVLLCVAVYIRQMRTAPKSWGTLMLSLRSAALTAICLSLLRPSVLRVQSSSEAGGIAILIDRSRSMSALDTGDAPAAQVAAAAALHLFPSALREEKTLRLLRQVESLGGLLKETRRTLAEEHYAQLVQNSSTPPSAHMAALTSQWRAATKSLSNQPLTAPLADLANGINQPGWADQTEKKMADALANLAAAQVRHDTALYQQNVDVQQACAQLAAMSRLDRARAAVTTLIAHLPANIPIYGAFFDSRLSPAILRQDGKPAWPADITATADESDITGAVRELLAKMGGTRLRALVLLSDGRPVGGAIAAPSTSNVPIFPVLCAGTPRDLVLQGISTVSHVYLDEPLTIHAEIRSANLADIPIPAVLRTENSTAQQIVPLDRAGAAVADFPLEFAHPGVQLLSISLPTFPGEASAQNNQSALRVDVAPQRMRVALLASFPNRDFEFLREQLRQSPWIESTVALPSQPIAPAQLAEQQVIVLNDLAARQLDAPQWRAIRTAAQTGSAGLILIAGPDHLPAEYLSDPRISTLLPFDLSAGSATWRTWAGANAYFRFQPAANTPFLSLQDDADVARQWSELPAMYHYLQIPHLRADVQPLLWESESASPVLTEAPFGKGRIFFVGFNETWRWRQAGVAWQARFWRHLIRHAAPLSDQPQQQTQPPEMADLSPQLSLLSRLAANSTAKVFSLSDVNSLWPNIQQFNQSHPVVIEYPLWHSPWLFAFILGCFGAEWALRKRFGLA